MQFNCTVQVKSAGTPELAHDESSALQHRRMRWKCLCSHVRSMLRGVFTRLPIQMRLLNRHTDSRSNHVT